MLGHLQHNVLHNAHRKLARDLHDGADAAVGSLAFGNLAPKERGQLGEQMLLLRVLLAVLTPRSQSLVLRDVTRPSVVREGFILPQLEAVRE